MPKSALNVTQTHVVAQHKHSSPIIACRFSPDGRFVYFAAEDHSVCRWEWSTDEKPVVYRGHNSWVRSIGCSLDGQTLITGAYDGQLIWWPADDPEPAPIREVAAHDGWVRALAVSPDGQQVGSVGNDCLVRLWNLSDGSLDAEFEGHEDHVYNLAFHPEQAALVSGDLKSNLIHWDLASGKQERSWKAEALYKYDKGFRADIGGYRALEFTADGQRLAGSGITNVTNAFAGVGNPAIAEFDWQSGEQLVLHESKAKLRGMAWGVALHPADITIGASGGHSGGFLLFWTPTEKEEHHSFKLPNTCRDLALASDGIHVATAHYDRHVRICRMTEKVA